MSSSPYVLSAPYRALWADFATRNSKITGKLVDLEDGAFFCGLNFSLENAHSDVVVKYQFSHISKNPDMAFLVAYAGLGMNTGLW